MVKTYSFLVWWGFFASLGLTIFAFFIVFSNSTLIHCFDGSNNEVPCSSVFTTGRKVGFVVSNVIGLLFHLCRSILLSSVRAKRLIPFPSPQTSVSSSGDTLPSSKTSRPTKATSGSTRRAHHTIPSKVSRATGACWTVNNELTKDTILLRPVYSSSNSYPTLCVCFLRISLWKI